jgi:uncharacterized protein YbjT (DUF2867 family)
MSQNMRQKQTYAVTAATGHIGERVSQGLLQAGQAVRAAGRDAGRLDRLIRAGATPMVGDLQDAGFVERLFQGADAAFLVVPPNRTSPDFRRYFSGVGANYAAAARTTGLPHALFISSQGADVYGGLVGVHGGVERQLDAVEGLNVLHLRAPYFFENLFYFLPRSMPRGVVASPIAPDAPLDMAATRDFAAAAVKLLLELSFRQSSVVELHGPRVLTMRKIAELLGAELGRPVPVEQTSREDDVAELVSMGTSRDVAELLNDTWKIKNRHGLLSEQQPTPANTMPTPIEAFMREQLLPALSGVAPSVDSGSAPILEASRS